MPIRALAVAVLLIFSAPAWGAEQTPAARVSAARTLMKQGKFDAALVLLRPLVDRRPVRADVLFLVGIASIGASQKPGLPEKTRETFLDAAITALRSILVRRPELVRVRLELARAFFLKGEDALARRHFEHVLAGKPPAGVALNVQRFLNQIRARKRWSLRLGAALAPDSNLGAGSDERIIYVPVGGQLLPFRRNEAELTKSGIGISAWLGGEYQYPISDRWRLRTGGDINRREYRASEFDRMTVAGHVGPRWLIGRASEVSLLFSALHEWAGSGIEEPSHYDLGIRMEGGHRLNRRTTLNARLSRHERRYDTRTHLDGPVTDISMGAGWVATPTTRIDATFGWGTEDPETERYRHDRRWVELAASIALPRGFTVGGSGTLRWTNYEGNWFPFTEDGRPRSDITRRLRIFAHNRAFTLGGFSPQVSFVREDRSSNAQLHDYERMSGELRFVRLF